MIHSTKFHQVNQGSRGRDLCWNCWFTRFKLRWMRSGRRQEFQTPFAALESSVLLYNHGRKEERNRIVYYDYSQWIQSVHFVGGKQHRCSLNYSRSWESLIP